MEPKGRKANHIPEVLRNLDTDARRHIENVKTFLLLSVVLLAMLLNSIWDLPIKQFSRMQTLFQ